jgi:tetratricopeptide (TPR) repeat protein
MDDELPAFEEPPGNEVRAAARALWEAAMENRDDEAGLAAVEDALARVEGSDKPDQEALVVLLHAKCHYLSAADRLEEALAICDQELEVADNPETWTTKRLALQAFLVRASVLGRLERPEEALESATAVVEAIDESEEDSDEPWALLRTLAVWGENLRLQQLVKLGRFGEATESWAALLERYGDDSELRIRTQAAWAGAVAAALLLDEGRPKVAMAFADEVIGRFRMYDEPKMRGGVAVAMQIRVMAFRKRGRILQGARAGSELMTFLGPDPEPSVIGAMRAAHPKSAEAWIRNARRFERT